MKSRGALLFLLISVLALGGCGPNRQQMRATVQAGINQTQTAAPPTPIPQTPTPAATQTPAASPTPAPVPLDFGGAGRILIQASQCLPQGDAKCADAPAGIYLSDLAGSAPQLLFEGARLLDVSPDGTRALISRTAEGGRGETLSIAGLDGSAETILSDAFASPYACDTVHCGALFLPDGSILFIGERENPASGGTERTVLKAAADGTAATPFSLSAPAANPLYFYRAPGGDKILWESSSDQVPGGVVSAAADGSAPAVLEGLIQPAFAPQGSALAFLKQAGSLGYETALFMANAPGEEGTLLYTPAGAEFVQHAVWSPDGSALALDIGNCAAACTTKHYLWRAGSSALTELAPGLGLTRGAPLWSPDGKFLFYIQDQPRRARTVVVETGQEQPFLDGLALPQDTTIARLVLLP